MNLLNTSEYDERAGHLSKESHRRMKPCITTKPQVMLWCLELERIVLRWRETSRKSAKTIEKCNLYLHWMKGRREQSEPFAKRTFFHMTRSFYSPSSAASLSKNLKCSVCFLALTFILCNSSTLFFLTPLLDLSRATRITDLYLAFSKSLIHFLQFKDALWTSVAFWSGQISSSYSCEGESLE